MNGVTYTNFSAGSLTLNNFGTLGTSNLTIDQSGQVTLDNTAFNQQRLTNATAPSVTFNTGSFTYLANNVGVTSAETLGTVTLNSGQSTINAGYATAPVTGALGSTLTISKLVRNVGATVDFIGGTANASPLGLATNGVLNKLLVSSGLTTISGAAGTFSANGLQYFGNGATGIDNIIPFAEVNGGTATNLATYTANGIAAFADYITQCFLCGRNLGSNYGERPHSRQRLRCHRLHHLPSVHRDGHWRLGVKRLRYRQRHDRQCHGRQHVDHQQRRLRDYRHEHGKQYGYRFRHLVAGPSGCFRLFHWRSHRLRG